MKLRSSLRPLRRDFPDDCTISVGRSASGPDLTVLGEGPAFELRARSTHLSDDHARIVCRTGEVTVEDHHSRNGTFVRLEPERPHPLDARPVRFGHDLVVVRDDPSRPLPQHLGHFSPEAFAAWLRSHLGDRLRVEVVSAPTAQSLPLVGTGLHVVARPLDEGRTLDSDAAWWLRAVVNTWNASARPLPHDRPWRFEALTAADRPYKKPKPVSECLAIMDRMAKEGHIDPDLYTLFVGDGIPLAYAREFLLPEQLDVG